LNVDKGWLKILIDESVSTTIEKQQVEKVFGTLGRPDGVCECDVLAIGRDSEANAVGMGRCPYEARPAPGGVNAWRMNTRSTASQEEGNQPERESVAKFHELDDRDRKNGWKRSPGGTLPSVFRR
jgi:hypothetical protein